MGRGRPQRAIGRAALFSPRPSATSRVAAVAATDRRIGRVRERTSGLRLTDVVGADQRGDGRDPIAQARRSLRSDS
jgi:hypothetical protein